MKQISGALMLAGLLALGTGCDKESMPGGPGAGTKPVTNPDGTVTTHDAGENAQTFTLHVPAVDMNVKQGEDEEVTIKIDRGAEFKQPVTIKITAPAGVVVTPNEFAITPDKTEEKVMVAAQADAPLGKAKIDVSAAPETGRAVAETFEIDVVKSDATVDEENTPPAESNPPPANP